MPPSHKRLPYFYEKKYSSEASPKSIQRETGFEPATLALARRCSTTEPLAQSSGGQI